MERNRQGATTFGWLFLAVCWVPVVMVPAFGGDFYTENVRFLSYIVTTLAVLASVVCFCTAAILRGMGQIYLKQAESLAGLHTNSAATQTESE